MMGSILPLELGGHRRGASRAAAPIAANWGPLQVPDNRVHNSVQNKKTVNSEHRPSPPL